MNTATHRLSWADFDALAAGGGGPDTIAVLRAAQLSRRILLIHALARAVRDARPEIYRDGRFDHSLSVLAAARRRDRAAVDEVLLHPQVGAWAMRCLRRLRGTAEEAASEAPLEADLGHFGAVVAAAALRAATPAETTVWIRDGEVMIPTYGLVRLPGSLGWGTARIDGTAGTVTVSGPATAPVSVVVTDADSETWLPARRLRSGSGPFAINLILDDLDPFRGYPGHTVTDRLRDHDVRRWQDDLDGAWALLTASHPAWAASIVAGMRSLVPLAPAAADAQFNATSADAVGAAAVTPPLKPLALASALVHEFQHTKLSSLLAIVDLCDDDERPVHYSPWRPDPRPLGGLFQGAYAYLGLTDFWRVQRLAMPEPEAQLAHYEFARCRTMLSEAIEALLDSPHLTGPGREFATGMQTRLDSWRHEHVPHVPYTLAEDAVVSRRTAWRLRHLHPSPAAIGALADAWTDGKPRSPERSVPSIVRKGSRESQPDPREILARVRLRDPERFRALLEDWRRGTEPIVGTSLGDALLVADDVATAAEFYRERIRASPGDYENWVGYIVSAMRGRSFANHRSPPEPEVPFSLYRILHARGKDPDPKSLLTWFGDV